MLRSMRALLGDAIVAQDGAIGFIADVYFDDRLWTVRYLVVDTGHPMPRREVLIRPALIAPEQPRNEAIRVYLTRAQVEKCPDADTDRPVYRQYDMATGTLRAIIEIIGAKAAVARRGVDRLSDDPFIEYCDDWAVPYIADLVGTRLINPLNVRGRRVDVASTIYYRRRNGTPRVLSMFPRDIAAWDGAIVESFRRLGRYERSANTLRGLHFSPSRAS